MSDVERNVALWARVNAEHTDRDARRKWASDEIHWGAFEVPEPRLRVLGDVAGLDVVELGCGTAYFSSWLARRGARPVGVDPTPAQLETARRMQSETGLEFPLVQAAAEAVPLPDASFDLVLSEYGASIWADPHSWIPEASRLLRPGGRLVFLRNSTLLILCSPDVGAADERLHRAQFGMYRFEWPESEGIEYHLGHGDWIDLLRREGFEIERLVEVEPHEDAGPPEYYDLVTLEWARKWPAEDIWVARKHQ